MPPMRSANTIAPTPTSNDVRAPQMHRGEHVAAVAVAAEEVTRRTGPCRTMSVLISFGSAIGRIGASTALSTTIASHAIASQAPMPSFRFLRRRLGRRGERRRRARPSAATVVSGSAVLMDRYPSARACRIRGSSTV